MYLVAIVDWYSRKVLTWQLSNTLDSRFCVDCLESALQQYGTPEIVNTDQGCQFTAMAFTNVLKRHGIKISMDGRGRASDNIFIERLWRSVKYEDIYIKSYSSVLELISGLTRYFFFIILKDRTSRWITILLIMCIKAVLVAVHASWINLISRQK